MSNSPEEVEDNVTLDHQVNYGGIVGKQWPKFDSDPVKHEHYEICVLDKSPDVTFITCRICFKCSPPKTSLNKCGIIKMINLYKIYNFKNNVESSKLQNKCWKRNNSTNMRKLNSKEMLGRRLINI